MERHKVFVAVYLLLFKDGKTLLSRRYKTGWRDGDYSMVAGHLEQNETCAQALVREAKEEACISVRESDLRLVHTLHRHSLDRDYIDLFFTCDAWEGEITIGEPDKCDDISWFPVDALPERTLGYLRQAIERVRAGQTYSESGWNGDAI